VSGARATKTVSAVMQTDATDCGIACLEMMFSAAALPVPEELKQLRSSGRLLSFDELFHIANRGGFDCRVVAAPLANLTPAELPAIAHLTHDHFVILEDVGDPVRIVDPAIGCRNQTRRAFEREFSGAALIPRSPLTQRIEFIEPESRLHLSKAHWIVLIALASLAALGTAVVAQVLAETEHVRALACVVAAECLRHLLVSRMAARGEDQVFKQAILRRRKVSASSHDRLRSLIGGWSSTLWPWLVGLATQIGAATVAASLLSAVDPLLAAGVGTCAFLRTAMNARVQRLPESLQTNSRMLDIEEKVSASTSEAEMQVLAHELDGALRPLHRALMIRATLASAGQALRIAAIVLVIEFAPPAQLAAAVFLALSFLETIDAAAVAMQRRKSNLLLSGTLHRAMSSPDQSTPRSIR